jgi:hypothetical protein
MPSRLLLEVALFSFPEALSSERFPASEGDKEGAAGEDCLSTPSVRFKIEGIEKEQESNLVEFAVRIAPLLVPVPMPMQELTCGAYRVDAI